MREAAELLRRVADQTDDPLLLKAAMLDAANQLEAILLFHPSSKVAVGDVPARPLAPLYVLLRSDAQAG